MIRNRSISVMTWARVAGTLAAAYIGLRLGGLPASSLTGHAAIAAETARVVRVIDGDTYVLKAGSTTYRLRLLGVDAPEQGQPFGAQATDSVARLLAPGRLVLMTRTGRDLYGRTLGAVRLPIGTGAAAGRPVPLDSLLVVRGWAWAWDPAHSWARRDGQQVAAQRAGRGLWKCGKDTPVTPKRWRGFNATIKRRYLGGCTW